MPLVVENRDEMYGGCDGSSFHPWMAGISMDGRIPPMACNIYNSREIDKQFEGALSRRISGICITTLPDLQWGVA